MGMDTMNLGPAEPDPAPASSRSGRTKRLLTTIGASAILLGGGAGIGVALTGGASASTTSAGTGATTSAAQTTSATAAGRCARIEAALRASNHQTAAARVKAFCKHPLLRLALVGGEYGEVTFKGKTSPKTVAFERGTVTSVSSSVITVRAADGTTWSWDLTSSTKVRSDRMQVTESALTTGDAVLVGGPVVSGTKDARVIRIRPSAPSAPSASSAPSSSASS